MFKELFKRSSDSKSSYEVQFGPANPFQSRDERDTLLQEILVVRNQMKEAWNAAADKSSAEANPPELDLRFDALEKQYLSRLPLVPLAVCPFCQEAYRHSIDPYGYDGHWWDDQWLGRQVACKHFRVIRIATHLNGHRTKTYWVTERVEFGPEVPYVIARILKLRSMVCVMSRLDLEAGYTFYPLVYFSRWNIKHDKLTSQWAGTYFTGYETRRENWDFELEPWVKKKSVRWCRSEGGKLQLQPAGLNGFPFLNLPGHRGTQYAKLERYNAMAAPVEGSSKYDGSND